MDDEGIPPTPERCLKVARKIRARTAGLGILPEDVIFDPLVLMAIACGVNCSISDPSHLCNATLAADVLLGRDECGMRYIRACRARKAR